MKRLRISFNRREWWSGPASVALLLALVATHAAGQDPVAAGASTRAELNAVLVHYDSILAGGLYSAELNERIEKEASLIRLRLSQGDFQPGDRVVMRVEGEPALSDTFTVQTGQVLDVPVVGALSLDGVLRSELQGHLESELARFLQHPVVSAQSLIRLSVLGEVGRPGFFLVSPSALLDDVLMTAGGPAAQADMDKLHIVRGDRTVWESSTLRQAMIEGRTLDALSLRSGDSVVLPEKKSLLSWGVIQGILVAVPSIILLIRELN